MGKMTLEGAFVTRFGGSPFEKKSKRLCPYKLLGNYLRYILTSITTILGVI